MWCKCTIKYCKFGDQKNYYMSTIFNTSDNEFIISRLNQLTSDSKALWGKMNVSQMIVHCQQPLLVSEGKLEVKRTLLGMVVGKMMKKKFLNYKIYTI